MRAYALTHLSDAVLLRDLAALVAQDRITTAVLLAHIAEADARRLYLQAGHPSMFAYCVDELRLSEDAAYKRIQAARVARAHPVIFAAVADGRLHLTAVRLLAPCLTPENADELLAAATHRRRPEIEQLPAQRFPPLRAPAPTVRAIPSEPMRKRVLGPVAAQRSEPAGEPVPETPPPPERYSVHVAIDRDTHDRLRYAQELLSHCVPSGDLAPVLDRALDALIGQLEQQKFAATTKPRPQQGQSPRKRHVSAHVRRAVWERDRGQCTFAGDNGRRCGTRKFLEFDHVDPVALGGKATVERMRLRCRAHNQYEAERTFGSEFMKHKRQAARRAAAETRAPAVGAPAAVTQIAARAAPKEDTEVLAGLRGLGFRAAEARRAAEHSKTFHDATLEERIRVSLKFLGRKPVPMPQVAPG
jgi:5-methylcytosine-specific restriction endonuclease McrA